MILLLQFTRKLGRTLVLLVLVAAGTILLMRFAPGYFADAREMDAKYALGAQSHLHAEEEQQGSLQAIAKSCIGGWLHANLGTSRQYDIPVRELIGPRLGVTASLLTRGVALGWVIAFCAALPLSAARHWTAVWGLPFTLLLAIPTGAMATLCLLVDKGGPTLVLMLLLASRDFKFLFRLMGDAWRAPHLLHARAQGIRVHRLVRVYVLPNVWPQVLALAMLSLLTALSAIVPIEVIFDVPGIGQLAWTAAMNRDLPVLMAITMLMAAAVAFVSNFSQPVRFVETA